MNFADGKLTLVEVLVIVVVLALLFANPMTRGMILFLLPLGSGVDDLIFIVLLVLAVVLGLVHFIRKRRQS